MISLILTLFISLLSIGPSINTIDDPYESRDCRISTISMKSLNSKNALEVDDSVHLEGAMSLSSNLKFWKEYASVLYGSKDNEFYTGYTKSSSVQSTSFTIDVTGVQGFKYTTNLQHFTNNGWSNWQDANLLDIYTFNFGIYRGANADYDYLTVIYRVSDGTTREVRMLDFDSGLLSGELVSGITYSSTNTPILYYDAFVYANYTSFDYCINLVNNSAYNDGFNTGYNQGLNTGYDQGYQYGVSDTLQSMDYDSTALTIFTGITSIALTPINMFLQIFNFEILGINLTGFISGILTLAVVVIIIRLILGGKKDD